MTNQPSPEVRSHARSIQSTVRGIGRRLAPESRTVPATHQALARTNRRAWFLLEAGRPALRLGRPALAVARTRD